MKGPRAEMAAKLCFLKFESSHQQPFLIGVFFSQDSQNKLVKRFIQLTDEETGRIVKLVH